MDLMMARRRLLLSQTPTQTIIQATWNVLENGYFSSADWKDRNSSETTTTFDNGIATTAFIDLRGGYRTTVCKVSKRTYAGHKYFNFFQCKVNLPVSTIGADCANIAWAADMTAGVEEWGSYVNVVTGQQDRNSTYYIPRLTNTGGLPSGIIAKTKNLLVVDLTLMFGAGNEPDANEFIRQCALNNVDLYTPHNQDSGTVMDWKI